MGRSFFVREARRAPPGQSTSQNTATGDRAREAGEGTIGPTR